MRTTTDSSAPTHRGHLRLLVALVALVTLVTLLLGACGTSTDTEVGGGPAERATGGWLDGSPADADAEFDESHGADGTRAFSAGGDEFVDADMSEESFDEVGDDIATAAPPDDTPLRAGSVDDNADFERYLAYRARIAEAGIPVRPLDVSVRHVVDVVGADGRPAHGKVVEVLADGEPVGSVRAGSNGRAHVHPLALGVATGTEITLRVAGEVQVPAGDVTTFELDTDGGAATPVPLDLFFILDATGSMGGEIGRLTDTIDSLVAEVAALPGDPDVRLGMTVYRDEGDAFVTRTFDFTSDVAAFQSALGEVRAAGGGDYPEALDEALAAALDEPSWRDPATTLQLAFVVADAPPQISRAVPKPYDVSLREAAERGIRIHTVATSGTDDQAEYVFRQFAQFTGARFVFLSHGAGGAAVGPGTDVTSLDDDQLPLDALMLRIVAEELDALVGNGDPTTPPPAPTTTIDPRQQQDD